MDFVFNLETKQLTTSHYGKALSLFNSFKKRQLSFFGDLLELAGKVDSR